MRSRERQEEYHKRLMVTLASQRAANAVPRDAKGKPLDRLSVHCPRCAAPKGKPCRRIQRQPNPAEAMPMLNIIHKERREALCKFANQSIEDVS